MDALGMSKLVMVVGLALFALLAAFGNITDAGSTPHRLLADHRGGGPHEAPVRRGCLAAVAGFLVRFVGFLVIAGEWFAVWQSAPRNGQESAFGVLA